MDLSLQILFDSAARGEHSSGAKLSLCWGCSSTLGATRNICARALVGDASQREVRFTLDSHTLCQPSATQWTLCRVQRPQCVDLCRNTMPMSTRVTQCTGTQGFTHPT